MEKYTQIDGLYWKSNEVVFFQRDRLRLDPNKVRVFFGHWAADDKLVYCGPHVLRKADAKTFVGLNPLYAKDKAHCFACPPGINGIKTMAKVDPGSFAVLDSGAEELSFIDDNLHAGYACDKHAVFFNGNAVKTADVETFVSLGGCYGRDAKQVYFEQNRLLGAHPRRWRRIGGYYSCDDQSVYWKHRKVPTSRPTNFFQPIQKFDGELAYDGERFFSRDEPCEASDAADSLHRVAELAQEDARLIESGIWQKNRHDWERSHRPPDETEFDPKYFSQGVTRESLEKRFGPGEEIPINDFGKWFDGEFDEDGEKRYSEDDLLVRWMRGRHVAVVWFQNGSLWGVQIRNAV